MKVRIGRLLTVVTVLAMAGCAGGTPSTGPVSLQPQSQVGVQYAGDTNPLRALDVLTPDPAVIKAQPVAGHSGLPILVFVHGGGWTMGSRTTYTPLSQTFANYGFLVVNVDYRLPPAVTVTGEISDFATAVSWVFQNATKYGGDTSEVFLMGHSAGGHLVAMTVIDPQWLAAAGANRSQIKGWITLSGSMNLATQSLTNPTVWPANAATTLNPLILPVKGAPPVFTSCTDGDAPFGCPDRDTLAGLYTAANMDVTKFLDPGQSHLSQVQPPETSNTKDPMYVAIHNWLVAHF